MAVLKGEKPDTIPCFGECPMDVTVYRQLLPASTGDPVADQINHARFFDNSTCNVGTDLKSETLSRAEDHHCYRYETGAIWKENYTPTFNRRAISFPINSPEEAVKFKMPDAHAPDRLDEALLREKIQAFHAAGYFVQGGVMGAWAGIYYYLTSFENILMWMGMEPEAAHALFQMCGSFSIASAKRLLACGADCIFTASDLGDGRTLLFSPQMFREYVFPWLKALADLCHEHGAYLHLHSHGHIQDIMDGIVEAGVDILNPVGPSDHNDLSLFKKQWGHQITLHGGISTLIHRMSEAEMGRHVAEVISIGRVGSRFFPRTESGIPPMPIEKVMCYINTLRKERSYGYG